MRFSAAKVFVLEKQFLIDQARDVGEQPNPFAFFRAEQP
jgi:hypothetical protein